MNLKKSEIENLVETARNFYQKGWTPATSGNLSFLVSRNPFRLAITPSHVSKSKLQPDQIIVVDDKGTKIDGIGNPSSDTKLHLAILLSKQEANVVFHIHSIWNTALSTTHASEKKIILQGYELLKALRPDYSYREKIQIPILKSPEDHDQLSKEFSNVLKNTPEIQGILLKKHGLYSWGKNIDDAEQRIEALEFLFEVLVRQNENK
jgi:methylthioribulose-1-phosphate dehydratase